MRNIVFFAAIILVSCNPGTKTAADALKPVTVTEPVQFDTDDPAIWLHPDDQSKSLIVGTDKETNGGLYVFNLDGKIVNKFTGLQRPNNVDIAYGVKYKNGYTDIAVCTERELNKVRVFSMPGLQPIDSGGLNVFEGETEKDPMGIAIYTRPADSAIFVIVGRKSGPKEGYLWQYQLSADTTGMLNWTLVRKFGKYSGKKEIESIAVDNELGYVYYSDEQYGVHKYYADPAKNDNTELALFGSKDFKEDIEGISIYKTSATDGYILISNQQDNSFNIYTRNAPHQLLAKIPMSTLESDGSEVTSIHLNDRYPEGLFVAMSNGKVFHYYDWRDIREKAGL